MGRYTRKVSDTAVRSGPAVVVSITTRVQAAPVSVQKRSVRFGERKPIWNMFTTPERNDYRIRSTGATMPVRMQPARV